MNNSKDWRGVLAIESRRYPGEIRERCVIEFDNGDDAIEWLNSENVRDRKAYVYHRDCIHLAVPEFAMAKTASYQNIGAYFKQRRLDQALNEHFNG